MISADQLRAAWALLGIGQRRVVELPDRSVLVMQRADASGGVICDNIDPPTKPVTAPATGGDTAGIELINAGAINWRGGRGVRLKTRPTCRKTYQQGSKKASVHRSA